MKKSSKSIASGSPPPATAAKRSDARKAQSMKLSPSKASSPSPVGRASRSSRSPDRQTPEQVSALDAEKQKALIEAERIKQHEKWVRANCTKIAFIFCNKTEREVVVDSKMASYMELQRHIARLTPKMNSIFAVQDEKGNIVKHTDNFKAAPKYVVREIHNRTMIPSMHPSVEIKWDFKAYHARPARWVDKAEIKRLAALAKKEEEAKMFGLSEERAGGTLAAALANKEDSRTDDAWENAVAAAEN